MIILDESKLTYKTIMSIGRDYGMECDCIPKDGELYEIQADAVIDRFKFDIDEFKEKLVSAIMNGIKIELKLK